MTAEELKNEIRFARYCERKFGAGHIETIRTRAKADMAYLRLCDMRRSPDVSHVEHVTVWRRE